MKTRIGVLAAMVLLALAGVAQAAGLFDNRPAAQTAVLKRERLLIHKAQQRGQANISRARRGPRGFRGPRGTQGPQGAPGPAGTFGTITQVSGADTYLCNWELLCSIGSAHAECPPGTRVIAGGWAGTFAGTVYFSFASGNGWSVGAENEMSIGTSYHATAMCAS